MTAPTVARPTADEMTRAAELAAELGRTPTSNEVVKTLGVGRAMANRIITGLDHSATVHPDHPGQSTTPDHTDHPGLTLIHGDAQPDTPAPDAVVTTMRDLVQRAIADDTDHPEQSTPDHPGPVDGDAMAADASSDLDGPFVVDMLTTQPLVNGGGLVVDRPAVHPGPVAQSTPDQVGRDMDQMATADADTDREQSTYGPVAGPTDHPMDRAQSTPVVDGPVAGPDTVDTTTTGLDHSTQQSTYGPVADTADRADRAGQSTPDGYTRRVRRLEAQAAEARQLRALHVQPDIRAVVLMRQRRMWTLLASVVLLITLASTAVNVQHFAAGGAPSGSTPWLAGWLVDPAFSLLLVGILVARGNLSTVRHKVTDAVVLFVEYGVLAAVLVMNITPELEAAHVDPGQVALHAFLPLLAFGTASALTRIQDHYAAAIDNLYREVAR
jgi:hypothetical protein